MTRARNSANLASDSNLFVNISDDRTGIGSVSPTHKLHVAGTSFFDDDVLFRGANTGRNCSWDKSTRSLVFDGNNSVNGNYAKARFSASGSYSMDVYNNLNNFVEVSPNVALFVKTCDLQVMGSGSRGGTTYDGAILRARQGIVELGHEISNGGATGYKLATTAYGVNVTGTTDTDGLIVSGVATVTTMNVTGVLTYDDVTSVDSIGIVTARQGIDVTGNITVSGTVDGVDIAAFKTSFDNLSTDIVSDTSPQLGGDLDTNDHHIHMDNLHAIRWGHTNTPMYFQMFHESGFGMAMQNGNGSFYINNASGNNSSNIFIRAKHDEESIKAIANGGVELYYDGAKTLETTVNALHLFGNAHECNIDFKIDNGNRVGFIGITNSGRVQINGAASGNAYETYLEGNLNGSTKLFYDNSVRIETMAAGAKVKRHSGGATTLFVEGAEGSTAIIDMFADDGDDNADKFRLQASTDGTFLMQNYASGGWETNIRTSGNGAVDLYHDNSVRFTTKSTGFEASGGSFTFYGAEGGASQLLIYADEGDDLNDRWRVMAGGSNDFIIGNLADASWDTSIKAYGDAGVHLYYNDNERLRTIGGGNSADGINVFGNASNSAVRMSTSDGTLRGILYANSSNLIGFLGNNGNWALSVENAGGNTVSYNNFNPSSGNSLDLGSSSAHWRRLYTGGITVSDNGVSDEIFKLRADDQSPWLFNLGNDTYHSTNGGLWGYQANNGDFYLRYRGNSEYKSFYIQRWNGSTSNLVAHFDYYGRFGGYYQNTLALQTAVDGIDVFAGADNQNGEIRIRARGTAVYSTLSFYSAAGASVGSVGTHSGAATIYYIAANSGSHLFHFGGAYKLHLTSSTVKPQTGVTLDLGTSGDPFNDLFIKNGTCSGTGAFKVSAGTTAQRPTGANGQLRYNSTLNILEGYINGAWTKVKGTGLAESGSYANNTQAIADDLYAYWSCDSTSTTRDGGDSGSATLYGVSSSSGKISNSWDRGTAAANGMNLTSMPTGNNWTLMFWLYLSSNTIHSTSDGAGILWLDSTQAGSVILGYDGSNGNNLRFGGNGWVSDGEVVFSSFGTTGVWRHMVITNNSNSWKFYLDGSLITTRSESMNNNGNWWLANYSRHGGNTNNHYFRGRLDEIAIWHRTLSAGEISETYNAQSTSATQLVP